MYDAMTKGDKYIVDTEISYHHPWLGRIYYRGFPIEDFINNNFSFLETAYFLISGEYHTHSEILGYMTSNTHGDRANVVIREVINSILENHLSPDVYGLFISSVFSRVEVLRGLEKILILYLDTRGYEDTLKVLKDVLLGVNYIDVLNNYRIGLKKDIEKVATIYKEIILDLMTGNEVKDSFIKKYCRDYNQHILNIIREVVHSELRDKPFLEKYNLIKSMERNIKRERGKYLNIDLYTPLLFEQYGILSNMPDILSIPGLFGMLAYILESSSYRDVPDKLVYKGPIGRRLSDYFKNHLKSK